MESVQSGIAPYTEIAEKAFPRLRDSPPRSEASHATWKCPLGLNNPVGKTLEKPFSRFSSTIYLKNSEDNEGDRVPLDHHRREEGADRSQEQAQSKDLQQRVQYVKN